MTAIKKSRNHKVTKPRILLEIEPMCSDDLVVIWVGLNKHFSEEQKRNKSLLPRVGNKYEEIQE
jgi:hypothetical protein